ncbi:MAG: hypothetical protein EOM30_11955 [Clostridia bacterium]|nr:hypothetical protein [Clostridia bacterium]NLS85751.1 hypothetical protein [Oscillospiraceae bacterium]
MANSQSCTIPDDVHVDFSLRCKGDSMIDARINDGDIVFIRKQSAVENGEIAAIRIGKEIMLKRVYIQGGTIALVPCNAKYPPMVYSGEAIENIAIMGKAVAFSSEVK